MTVAVTRVVDLGNDVLEVSGTVDDQAVTATGWVSAMSNYYPATAYDSEGHLKASATPAEMTDRQKTAYWKSLLTAVQPETNSEPVVIFEA